MRQSDPFSPPKYSPQEQDAILAMASRLQGESARDCSIHELEQIASESGIDPRFVHEAARRLDGMPESKMGQVAFLDRWAVAQALTAIVLYIPVQLFLTASLIRPGYHPTVEYAVALILAGLLGLVMPRGRQWRPAASVLSVASTMLAVFVLRISSEWYFQYGNVWPTIALMLFLQSLTAFLAHYLQDRVKSEQRRGL